MARMIETTIDIDAPVTVVWDMLTDFGRYPEWSSFILGIDGDVAPGKVVKVRLNDGGGEMTMGPRILDMDAPHRLTWQGKVGASWVFSGQHCFVLTELKGGRTRLSHSERFTGLLVPVLWKTLDTRTRPAFDRFNEALRSRSEAQHAKGAGSGECAT